MVANRLNAKRVLSEQNAELKREMIEAMGIDRFFAQLDAQIVHSDVNAYGDPRILLRIPLVAAQAGYIQAVRVICPTTKRIYHLGVPPTVKTCQEAIASTFGLKAKEYHPDRES